MGERKVVGCQWQRSPRAPAAEKPREEEDRGEEGPGLGGEGEAERREHSRSVSTSSPAGTFGASPSKPPPRRSWLRRLPAGERVLLVQQQQQQRGRAEPGRTATTPGSGLLAREKGHGSEAGGVCASHTNKQPKLGGGRGGEAAAGPSRQALPPPRRLTQTSGRRSAAAAPPGPGNFQLLRPRQQRWEGVVRRLSLPSLCRRLGKSQRGCSRQRRSFPFLRQREEGSGRQGCPLASTSRRRWQGGARRSWQIAAGAAPARVRQIELCARRSSTDRTLRL